MQHRIYQLRKERLNLSRAKFGAPIGMTDSEIRNIEDGKTELKDNKIPLICREYNVNEQWLRTGVGDMFLPKSEQDELEALFSEILGSEDSDNVRKLARAFAKLTIQQRHEAAELVAALARNMQ